MGEDVFDFFLPHLHRTAAYQTLKSDGIYGSPGVHSRCLEDVNEFMMSRQVITTRAEVTLICGLVSDSYPKWIPETFSFRIYEINCPDVVDEEFDDEHGRYLDVPGS